MLQPSPRVAGFSVSMIREMTRLATEYKAINTAQGFPDFPPPREITDALATVSAAGHHQYSNSWGSASLRRAVAQQKSRTWGVEIDPETEVTITCGVTEAIVVALESILSPGDEVLVLEPAHENYYPAALMAGATARWVSLRPPDFRLDIEALRAACGRHTRAIILNTPHNPTGRVFDRAELAGLAQLCQERDLFLVTDEIYEHLTYDGLRHTPPATLPGMRERTLTASGIGKTFACTGWRLGYLVAPPAITEAIRKWHDFTTICAPTPLQEAAAVALETLPPSYYTEVRDTYQRRRDRFVAALNSAGLRCVPPQGAYYAFADVTGLGFDDGWTAVQWLLKEAGVAAVPGASFFGGNPELGRRYLRFAFCKKDETLEEVERRLARVASSRR